MMMIRNYFATISERGNYISIILGASPLVCILTPLLQVMRLCGMCNTSGYTLKPILGT